MQDDFDVTPQWLGHVLRDNNETRKRTRQKHEVKTRFRKPIDMKKEAKLFYLEVMNHKLDDIICLDESSVSSTMITTYSRCKQGRRCVKKTGSNNEPSKPYYKTIKKTDQHCQAQGRP